MSGAVQIIDGMIDLIDKNLVAKTNAVSNIMKWDVLINVEDSFHFLPQQEIVIIDYNYNVPTSPHYQVFEYAVVKNVINTHYITLTSPVLSDWLVSDHAFIQKTIGHSPLYSDKILFGDREVIPTEEMAITVEPSSLSNEWLYLHGGLSEEYRVSIMIYGKNIETEEGMKILIKYADAVYELFNRNIHIDITSIDTPLLANVAANTNSVVIENTVENLEYFVPSALNPSDPVGYSYDIQDNLGAEINLWLNSVNVSGAQLLLDVYYQNPANPAEVTVVPNTLNRSYSTAEYAVFRRHGRYFYDSRVDNIEYGMVQKGSAFIRAAKLNWFGKEVTEHRFPQRSDGVNYFPEVTP